MKTLHSLFIFIIFFAYHATGLAQASMKASAIEAVPEVEWYPPETEKGRTLGRSRVIITGRTQASSKIVIDADSVTVMSRISGLENPKMERREVQANFEGFFEINLELPQGLAQIPIQVSSPRRATKTFMISVDVKIVKNTVSEVKIKNAKVSQSKPPAAAKRIRLWSGAGWTYQSNNQSTTDEPNLKFQTIQAPGVVLRGGYWGDSWGLDLYFRDAPGSIQADPPLTVLTSDYHWRTMEAKGLYQMDRGPESRMMGLPSQWQVRFGTQSHQVPLLEISDSNAISVRDVNILTGTLGIGLLLGQEQSWSYEFAVGVQQPLGASSPGGEFKITPSLAFEAQLGAAYKFSPNWRIGLFSYTQSLNYTYDFKPEGGTSRTGQQKLFYTTFDLRLGYEF